MSVEALEVRAMYLRVFTGFEGVPVWCFQGGPVFTARSTGACSNDDDRKLLLNKSERRMRVCQDLDLGCTRKKSCAISPSSSMNIVTAGELWGLTAGSGLKNIF